MPGGPGTFVHVPEHGVHGFRNDTNDRASFLVLFSPGTPREEFFTELADMAASGRQLSQNELIDFYQRHDQYMVDIEAAT